MNVSRFAPKAFPRLPSIGGLKLGVAASGLRYRGRDDLLCVNITTDNPTIAAVFTTSHVVGEPVKWSRDCLPNAPSHLVVAAGNANVFTGVVGWKVLENLAAQLQAKSPQQVYFAMTGVIGEPFSATPLADALRSLEYHTPTPEIWQQAACAITTTDTFAKGSHVQATIGGKTVKIVGIAKGSGMIAPNMATMLAFLFTDANMPQHVLQELIEQAVEQTFHCISVDSDTSTSDTVKLIATGSANNPHPDNPHDTLYDDFRKGLLQVCQDLAGQVIRDGEGITKLLKITVKDAQSESDAKKIALSIANSPLVKTAANGEDANWGRIAMAVGKAGVPLDQHRLSITVGTHLLASGGAAVDFDTAAVDDYMRKPEITITVSIGQGTSAVTVYGNDLSHDYIRINADYRS